MAIYKKTRGKAPKASIRGLNRNSNSNFVDINNKKVIKKYYAQNYANKLKF